MLRNPPSDLFLEGIIIGLASMSFLAEWRSSGWIHWAWCLFQECHGEGRAKDDLGGIQLPSSQVQTDPKLTVRKQGPHLPPPWAQGLVTVSAQCHPLLLHGWALSVGLSLSPQLCVDTASSQPSITWGWRCHPRSQVGQHPSMRLSLYFTNGITMALW